MSQIIVGFRRHFLKRKMTPQADLQAHEIY